MRSYHPAKFAKIWISLLKFKFSQILLGDKNATYLCSKIIFTLLSRYLTTVTTKTQQNILPCHLLLAKFCTTPWTIQISLTQVQVLAWKVKCLVKETLLHNLDHMNLDNTNFFQNPKVLSGMEGLCVVSIVPNYGKWPKRRKKSKNWDIIFHQETQ